MALSKIDIAALRKADDISVHLHLDKPQGVVRLIKRKHVTAHDPFAVDTEHTLDVPVSLYGSQGRDGLAAGAVKCHALVGLYHSQHSHASCVINTLRVGDEIEFVFAPDHHSNGYVASAGLHADALKLYVRRQGKRVAEWTLYTGICSPNSARMCDGVVRSREYERMAADRRANA